MIRISQKRKREIKKEFTSTARAAAWHDWGGYTEANSWNHSCGNTEWGNVSNDQLPYSDPDEVAYWLQLMRQRIEEKKLGSWFLAYPSWVENGKPMPGYEVIAAALKKEGIRRLTRAINPNHRDHYQDTYLLVKDNY